MKKYISYDALFWRPKISGGINETNFKMYKFL